MVDSATEPSPSLREKKRRATLAAIYDHASRLVVERGFDAVTVDDICEAANISRRTLFNYVDSKETAVLGPPPRPVTDEEAEEFAAQVHDDLPLAVLGLIVSTGGFFNDAMNDSARCGAGVSSLPSYGHPEASQQAAILLHRHKQITARDSRLTLHRLTARHASFSSIVATVTRYLHEHPDRRLLDAPVDEEATIAVTQAMSAMQLGLSRWMRGDEPSIASLYEHTSTALSQLRGYAATVATHTTTSRCPMSTPSQ